LIKIYPGAIMLFHAQKHRRFRMANFIQTAIATGLGDDGPRHIRIEDAGDAELPSCFDVSGLAAASVRAAALECADLMGACDVAVDQKLASAWFDMTLRPVGWDMPSLWDSIAGVYQTKDGWVRLHTNAPHHKAAALKVLGCREDASVVSEAVAGWEATALETAIVEQGGAAAELRSMADWAAHPQGRAVAQEPLIHWDDTKAQAGPGKSLDGLKVLDLTRVLAGPVATRFLAGFGANVLRIDPPWWSEPGVEPEVTLGKTLGGLNLSRASDRETFDDLLSQADVLVHGYRPGALAGLGYGPETLKQRAPGLIDVSLCAYGWTGPWAGRRGFDSLVQMSCGLAHEAMMRTGAQKPVPLPVQALDHACGYLIAAAALRAVRRHNTTGQVQSARLSLARVAHLLMSAGAHDIRGRMLDLTDDDLAAGSETTDWGPARRVRFPVQIDGALPNWPRQAGRLRRDPPRWPT
jgi:crotonobetainyl-CoA:carnitine CoA-transferase CaiB-like acyl-CoA transferase